MRGGDVDRAACFWIGGDHGSLTKVWLVNEPVDFDIANALYLGIFAEK